MVSEALRGDPPSQISTPPCGAPPAKPRTIQQPKRAAASSTRARDGARTLYGSMAAAGCALRGELLCNPVRRSPTAAKRSCR
eukprot:351440-Chlamydomonas_euryale.AAC.2